MSELPKGWAAATLNDLLGAGGLFSDGDWVESKDQDPDGQNRLLQLADIGDGFFVDKSSRFVNDEKFSSLNCTEVKAGDVLIARMPDPLGRACLMPAIPQRCLTVVDVAVFRVGETGISNKWLMHFLNSSPVRREIELNSSGTTRKRISRGKLGEILLPVPPLAEQTRIAQKLDELLAQVDTLKARIDAIPALLKRFRQSILAASVSGRLVAGENDSAPKVKLGDYCDVLGGKRLPKGYELTSEKNQHPYIRVTDFSDYSIDNSKIKYLPANAASEISKYIITDRDIYISIAGSIGLVGQVPSYLSGANLTENAARIIPKGSFDPKYLMYQLAAPDLQAQMQDKQIATTQPKLGLFRIKDLDVVKPNLEVQRLTARKIESLFALADQLEAKVATAQARIDRLTQSILAKAFRGELVPQDPNDEPASVMLERIKAQRAAAPKAKRARKDA